MAVFLETQRLILRRFTDADVEHLVGLHNDPAVMHFLNGGKPRPREDIEREYSSRFAGDGYWAAEDTLAGEFLGWFGFHPTEGRDPQDFELGFRLRRSAWGQGYATEGSRALIRKGFTELGLRRVWAQAMAANTRSRRVMEKAGLVYVRTFHPEFDDPIPGTEHGEVEYALTKTDWDRWTGRDRSPDDS
ncbi:MAG: GNAT family N-acetyltransferase [Candidatus Dormibacteraeota bacterium]|nr:GNAT family N-acetyltransferase [Candidatus Dormibacteraeota bacterium]